MIDYNLLQKQLDSLLSSESDTLASMANFCAFIFENIPDINWAGFYLYKENQLVLGPFQGKVACTRIDPGKGVCGTAFEKNETIVVPNVHDFSGHIACDSASNSEIVFPLNKKENRIGVFDIDSPLFDRFSAEDKNGIGKLVQTFLAKTDF